MIRLSLPGVSQQQFEDAFAVLDECRVDKLPVLGFTHPFMGPGGAYGACWWERDTALTLSGYRWVDQTFCENVLRNFVAVQRPNGRIPLWGNDRVEDYDLELSAIPVLFEVAYKVLRRSSDEQLIAQVYDMLARYMNWWLSDVKRDSATGLVAGIFEESDPSDFHDQHTAAQVDLNVQICVGADVLAQLAAHLGRDGDVSRWQSVFAAQKAAVNAYLYDPDTGAYYTRLLTENRLMTERLYNATFDVFKRRILPVGRAAKLLALLQDDAAFGYHSRWGLTTMARTSCQYVETVGVYQGAPSWSGNIWTLRNEIIITGLHEYGCLEQAAHLALQTVQEFAPGYTEFLSPSTGIGHGVLRYGWTAAQCIQLIIEELFGIDWCAWTGELTVRPNLPKELLGVPVSITGVPLPDGRLVDVHALRTADGTQCDWRVYPAPAQDGMELLFLGTAAEDYSTRLQTDLKDKFDLDARRASVLLVNGHILVDCGDHVLQSLAIAGIAPAAITHVLVTHGDSDHFRPEHLYRIALGTGHPIDLYGNARVLRLMDEYTAARPGGPVIATHLLQSRPQPIPVQAAELLVTPLAANHASCPGEDTLHLLLECGSHSLFYGIDGAWLPTATGHFLMGKRLSCAVFDATCGDYVNDYRAFDHNTIPMVRAMVEILRAQDAFAPDAKLYLTHIAPSLHRPHAEIEQQVAADGLLVAYDGLKIKV